MYSPTPLQQQKTTNPVEPFVGLIRYLQRYVLTDFADGPTNYLFDFTEVTASATNLIHEIVSEIRHYDGCFVLNYCSTYYFNRKFNSRRYNAKDF